MSAVAAAQQPADTICYCTTPAADIEFGLALLNLVAARIGPHRCHRLRTDHVAGDNLRRVNYWYRHGSLLPMARVPGFFGHQTDRSRGDLANPNIPMAQCQNQSAGGVMSCYKRDYDYLGYRYALMSQLATAGLNNVLCMLPARDESEFALFPKEDVAFIHDWLAWTDAHIPHLTNTVPLPGMDEVGLGLVDGSAAFAKPLSCSGAATAEAAADGVALGFVWAFNPGYSHATASITLDDSLSPFDNCTITTANNDPKTPEVQYFDVTQLYPTPGKTVRVAFGNDYTVDLAGSSAVMLQISAAVMTAPKALGIVAEAVSFDAVAGTLELNGVLGEVGTVVTDARAHIGIDSIAAGSACADLQLRSLVVNGLITTADQLLESVCIGHDCGACEVQLPPLRFGSAEAAPFPHAAPVALVPGPVAPNGNATFTGSATVPEAIFAQLKARDAAYPVSCSPPRAVIRAHLCAFEILQLGRHSHVSNCCVYGVLQIKWGPMDDDASWLRPGRLLLFLQLNCSTGRSGACDDKMPASLTVDGSSIHGIKAYESRCTVRL